VKRQILNFALTLLAIPAVIFVFKIIVIKQQAALVASLIFLSLGLSVLWTEVNSPRKRRSWAYRAAFLFLLVGVVPMLALRLLYWGVDFANLRVGPIGAQDYHRYSSWLYGFLILGQAIEIFRSIKLKKQP
jgi:hypothetical protein